MSPKDTNFVIAGVIICLMIAVLAPFITSTEPDGFEKTTEQISTTESSPIFESPLQDYTFEPLGKYGEIVALILGVLVTLTIGYIVAILIRRKNPPKVSK